MYNIQQYTASTTYGLRDELDHPTQLKQMKYIQRFKDSTMGREC